MAWESVGNIESSPSYMCRLDSSYTLANSGSAQKLFNASTNGALTLPLGAYLFRSLYYLTGMSATSGYSSFKFGGTAVLGGVLMKVTGVDGAAAVAATQTGSSAITSAFPASQNTATTATAQYSAVEGTFKVTTAGTLIPQITLVTAAAAVVAAGSYFECWPVATATEGPWS